MGLVQFAENELKRLEVACGDDEEALKMQKMMTSGIMRVIQTFAEEGHSGFSASYAIGLITRLLDYKPITPLTGEDDEWEDTSKYGSDDTTFQNKRCPSVFKNKEGETYIIDAKVFSDDGGNTWFTSRDSRVLISFPYTVPSEPERVLVDKQEDTDENSRA